KKHLILPVQVEGSMLLLAMAEPQSQTVIEETSFSTGLSVLPLLALHSRISEAIGRAYLANAPFYCGPDADAKADVELVPIVRHDAPSVQAAASAPPPTDDVGVDDVGVEIVV